MRVFHILHRFQKIDFFINFVPYRLKNMRTKRFLGGKTFFCLKNAGRKEEKQSEKKKNLSQKWQFGNLVKTCMGFSKFSEISHEL